MKLQERLRAWNGSTITIAKHAQEAANALDAQEARIKRLEDELRWILDYGPASEGDYEAWKRRAREALKGGE